MKGLITALDGKTRYVQIGYLATYIAISIFILYIGCTLLDYIPTKIMLAFTAFSLIVPIFAIIGTIKILMMTRVAHALSSDDKILTCRYRQYGDVYIFEEIEDEDNQKEQES